MAGSLAKTRTITDLYERDFHAWTVAQALALRRSRPADVDWQNIAEEIESLGRTDKRSIESNLNVVLLHLLKWHYQPKKRKAGWKSSIAEHRARLLKLLKESPSLRNYPLQVLEEEYALARVKAADETGLSEDEFPKTCPFGLSEVLDPEFWPDNART